MRRAWLLLVFAASLALLLWRSPRDEGGDNAANGAARSVEPGYVALGATLFDTGVDGNPLYRLTAKRIEQLNPLANIDLESPQFFYQGQTEWSLTAQRGTLPAVAQHITLSGDVLAIARRPHSAPLRIRTATLDIDMPNQRLDSSAAVAIDWGPNRLWAAGLHADMKADSLRLESHAHGEFFRH